jgi:hypothetical protein
MITKIVVGGLEISSENGYYLQSMKDFGYKTKYPVAKTTYTHGAKIGDVYLENKSFVIELMIVGDTVSDFLDKRSALYKVLTINEFEPDTLSFDFYLSNNMILEAGGVIKDINTDVNAENISAGLITFMIEMEEPFFKSKQQYQIDFPITDGGGFSVPMAVPLDMSAGSTGFTQVNNGGNIFVFPKIYFMGPLTNPILKNETSGKQIALTATLSSNEYIYVDTYNRIVTDDTGANVRDTMVGDFLTLGLDLNEFSLRTDTSEAGYIRMVYQYYFISI